MQKWILFGIAAGFVSASMQLAVLAPSFFSILLYYFSAIPLFIVGFSFGQKSVYAGAGVGAVLIAGLSNSVALPALFVMTTALAPVIATRLAMISRPAEAAAREGEVIASGRQWYPEGRILIWFAGIATFASIIIIYQMGSDLESYKAFLTKAVSQLIDAFEKQQMPGTEPVPREMLVSMMLNTLPVVVSSTLLITTIASMRIAIVIMRKSKYLARPFAPFASLSLPANAIFAPLAAILLAWLLTGIAKLFALGAVGAFITAYTILGLAIIHGLLQNNPTKPLLLGFIYGGLVIFNWVLALPLALLGLLDFHFNFRKKIQKTS